MSFREQDIGRRDVTDRFTFRDELSPRAERVLSDYDDADLQAAVEVMVERELPLAMQAWEVWDAVERAWAPASTAAAALAIVEGRPVRLAKVEGSES